ncbi:hypothetical protein SDC9_108557 [bioreactor metagenome]|uniref:Uncharacterized protein n=1 Tax=bioreactor metagenome TaxID=1076179 RepID=A0A645B8H3_9ZZZZ
MLHADEKPHQNESAQHQAPKPLARRTPNRAGRRRPAENHHRRPAHQLQHVERGKQQTALLSEGHFHGFHGAFPRPAADETGAEQQRAADDVADENGSHTPGKAQRGKKRAGENFRDGHRRAEPDQTVCGHGGFLLVHIIPLSPKPYYKKQETPIAGVSEEESGL